MSATPQAPREAAPDVSIRAKPPSPKRLSRKVLLSASLAIGGIIAFALVSGLSARPDRRDGAEAEAVAAAGGPPESVRLASGNYQPADLPQAEASAASGDILWGDHPPDGELAPPQNEVWAGPSRASARGAETPDPQTLARVSPILFGEGGAQAASASDNGTLDATLTPPRSGYELLAGAVIPAALSTELNSDLPGRAIAQVTQPVYDSVTGAHLLIPQGARLLGTYDSATTYGDRRLLLVWNRLILPNGWSINLQGMEGAGPTGAAGLADRTDNHLAGLAGAIGLSAIISVIANEAENDEPNSLAQSVGDAAAQEAARTGGRIVDRELNVRPTLRVRAGAPVRVLVTRSIRLRPTGTEAQKGQGVCDARRLNAGGFHRRIVGPRAGVGLSRQHRRAPQAFDARENLLHSLRRPALHPRRPQTLLPQAPTPRLGHPPTHANAAKLK